MTAADAEPNCRWARMERTQGRSVLGGTIVGGIALLRTTGDERIDAILRGLIEAVEAAFPDRVRGYYLKGSYTDGSAVATSDIDLTIVFKGAALVDAEAERAQRLGEACSQGSPARIDLDAVNERCLRQEVAPSDDSPCGEYLA